MSSSPREVEVVRIPREVFERLLAVATLYVESFSDDDALTLPERLNLRYVEDILGQYGKRY